MSDLVPRWHPAATEDSWGRHHSLLLDLAVVVLLTLFVAQFEVRRTEFPRAPFEDAAILMRYAEHFARGHGIVWNIGGKPVDGATDFLFMVCVGWLVKAGLSLELAARSIGLASHVLTVATIYLASRRLCQAGLVPAVACALYLAIGPGLGYVAAGFGTTFFALWASITWCVALAIIVRGETHTRSVLLAVSALLTGLVRPEGVILSGLMLCAIVCMRGIAGSRRTIRHYLMIFGLCGGLYFLWRWRYFGYPLPNPFYVKGGGHLFPLSLSASVENVVWLCLPFLPLWLPWPDTARLQRSAVGLAIPVWGFAFAFVCLSNAMNYFARFQYAALPVCLLSWSLLLARIQSVLHIRLWRSVSLRNRAVWGLCVMAFLLGAVQYQRTVGARPWYICDGKYDAALVLRDYARRGFTIATTEAGLLPLYSGWRAVDTWGLNDPWIVHHGGITDTYLDRFRPHVVMFHEFRADPKWSRMVRTLKAYVESRGYALAGAFGRRPQDTHRYYVRTDFPESAQIIERLRLVDYGWWDGTRARNFASEVDRTPVQ